MATRIWNMEITVQDIVDAIKVLAEHKGSSRAALMKHFKSKSKTTSESDADTISVPLKKALDEGVKSGELVAVTKMSFKAKGIEFEPPKDSTVVIEQMVAPSSSTTKATDGCTVQVAYKGTLLEEGSVFDEAEAFEFELGAGEVIKGWDQGIKGMRVGEKRKLTIPPKLGYGKRGSGKEIPPDSWLVFEVELKKITE